MNNYSVIMAYHRQLGGWYEARHLPRFLMPAYSPKEAITKVKSMFPSTLRLTGTVNRDEPRADEYTTFDTDEEG